MTQTTMEELLAMAGADPVFREALLADRQVALHSRGIELRDSDAAMLASIPDAQLEAMLDQLAAGQIVVNPADAAVQCTGIRPDRRLACEGIRPSRPVGRILLAAAAGTAIVGGVATTMCITGSRPDTPQKTAPVTIDAGQQNDADAGVDDNDENG